jgi:hypothetical protein
MLQRIGETQMNFFPHSAIEIPRHQNGLVAADKNSLQLFWSQVDIQLEANLSDGIGCYIFSIRAGRGVLPWYVGLAERQSFSRECFTAHKINHYNNAIADRAGRPLLTLIAKYSPGQRLISATGSEHRDIQFLEGMLLSTCLRRNPDLYNKRDTKLLREMVVPGLINTPQGKAHTSVAEFRDLIGV